MDMLEKRLIAREVFLKLDAMGYKAPVDDPSPKNRERWRQAFLDQVAACKNNEILNLPMLVIWTTSVCTLSCKYCGNYTPILRKKRIKYGYKFEDYKEDIAKIANSVDSINRLVFAGGGETLLTPALEDFLQETLKYDNIHTIILSTNGTVKPKDKILEIIKEYNRKFIINCSDYSELMGEKYTERRNGIVELFRNRTGVNPIVSNPVWLRTSLPVENRRTPAELKQYYEACMHIHGAYFTSIWDGKMYTCPRQGVFDLLGYPVNHEDYLDLREFNSNIKLRTAILDFYRKEFYQACDYCNNVEDSQHHVQPGEQLIAR